MSLPKKHENTYSYALRFIKKQSFYFSKFIRSLFAKQIQDPLTKSHVQSYIFACQKETLDAIQNEMSRKWME